MSALQAWNTPNEVFMYWINRRYVHISRSTQVEQLVDHLIWEGSPADLIGWHGTHGIIELCWDQPRVRIQIESCADVCPVLLSGHGMEILGKTAVASRDASPALRSGWGNHPAVQSHCQLGQLSTITTGTYHTARAKGHGISLAFAEPICSRILRVPRVAKGRVPFIGLSNASGNQRTNPHSWASKLLPSPSSLHRDVLKMSGSSEKALWLTVTVAICFLSLLMKWFNLYVKFCQCAKTS